MKNTLIVNFLGGPGISKSTTTAGVFNKLKKKSINCELLTEWAKEAVWAGRTDIFKDQIYMFGEQYHRIFNLLGKVDVVINDGCLLLNIVYDPEQRKLLTDLVLREYHQMNNFNIILHRQKEFVTAGRIHNEKEALEIDSKILDMLGK